MLDFDAAADILKNTIQPKGVSDLVYLNLGSIVIPKDKIDLCFDEFKKINTRLELGDKINPLETFAIQLLLDVGGISLE